MSGHSATRPYVLLHLCVLLWGFTPIFGRLISLDAVALVWWRMAMTAAALMLVPRVWRALRTTPWRCVAAYAGLGVLLGVTWALFYSAIKLSNASVGAICLAVTPLFLVFVEPVATGSRFNAGQLLLGIGVIPGVALVVGGIPSSMYAGLATGLVSVAVLAVFVAYNKRLVNYAPPMTVVCIEMAAGTLALALLAPFVPHAGAALPLPAAHDAMLLLLFALACTLLPMVLLLTVLHELDAFTTQMATNLEPVYAILLAIPLLGEQLEMGTLFYVGVMVVMGSVFTAPLPARYQRWRGRNPHVALQAGFQAVPRIVQPCKRQSNR